MQLKTLLIWVAALAAGAGVGVAWRFHRREVPTPVKSPETSKPNPPNAPVVSPPAAEGFASRAQAYLTRLEGEFARLQKLVKGVDPKDSKAMGRIQAEWESVLAELNPAVLKLQADAGTNPEDYLKLLRSATSQSWPFLVQLPFESAKGPHHYTGAEGAVTYERLPAGMVDYLLEVLRTGETERKRHVAHLISYLRKQPEEVTRRLIGFLADPDPHVAYPVLEGLNRETPSAMDFKAHAETLKAMLSRAQDDIQVQVAMESVSRIATLEADEFLLGHATGTPNLPSHAVNSAVMAVYDRAAKRGTEKLIEDHCLQALAASLRREEPAMNFSGVVVTLFRFPLPKALSVIEGAAGRAPTAELRDQLFQIAAKIREGETRTDILRQILYPGSGRTHSIIVDDDD